MILAHNNKVGPCKIKEKLVRAKIVPSQYFYMQAIITIAATMFRNDRSNPYSITEAHTRVSASS